MGDYRIFFITPLDEPFTGPNGCLKISSLLKDEINEDTKQPVFINAIRTFQDAFAYFVDQFEQLLRET